MPLTPAEIADRQVRAAQGAGDKMIKGAQAVSESPTQAAKRAKQKMINAFNESMNDGTYEAGCDSVTAEDWRKAFIEKGVQRYATGVQAAKQRIIDFWNAFQPHQESVRQQVRAMPDLTLEDRIQRAVANMRGLAQFKYRRGRR